MTDFNAGELSGMTAAAMTAFMLADGRLKVSFWEAGSSCVITEGFEAEVLSNGSFAVLYIRQPTLELECVAAVDNAAKMKLGVAAPCSALSRQVATDANAATGDRELTCRVHTDAARGQHGALIFGEDGTWLELVASC